MAARPLQTFIAALRRWLAAVVGFVLVTNMVTVDGLRYCVDRVAEAHAHRSPLLGLALELAAASGPTGRSSDSAVAKLAVAGLVCLYCAWRARPAHASVVHRVRMAAGAPRLGTWNAMDKFRARFLR